MRKRSYDESERMIAKFSSVPGSSKIKKAIEVSAFHFGLDHMQGLAEYVREQAYLRYCQRMNDAGVVPKSWDEFEF